MANDRRGGLIGALRNLALSLEHHVASEAASGAVHGAADGLREELPELDAQLRDLLHDLLTVLGRMAHQAAEHEAPGAVAHTLSAAAMKGALEMLAQEWQHGGLPLHSLMERLDRVSFHVVEFARSRTAEIRAPGDRARLMVRGVAQEASKQFHEAVPALTEDVRVLAPLGAEVASQVGRGLVDGLQSKLHEDADALLGLLERAGRGLVRGVAAGVREELSSGPLGSGEALGASMEKLAQRSAAATIRGALSAFGEGLRRPLEALRRPLVAVAGAGSALMLASVVVVGWRALR
ncbi:hypothetical protein ACLESO_17325 [Pyxidicoccus sp. 3LG]